jgi:catechol 2,3-dioxygenase-like lactoylglutathione lyase family enzyme
MKPSIKVITLAVGDLGKSLAFYRDGLGLPTKGVIGEEFDHGSVAFFNLEGGLILALYPAAHLQKDSGIEVTSNRLGAVTIGHVVGSKAEVDAVLRQAADAGATIVNSARDRFWGGYSGYFRDLDEHLWEVAWNPHLDSTA